MNSYSVILTTHRRPRFLRRAIESVKRQRPGCVELVLVSDVACAETRGVASALLSPTDTFLERDGVPGPAESRNQGMARARGDFVIFLDDDDALSPGYIEAVDGLVRESDVVFTDYDAVFEHVEGDDLVPHGRRHHSLAASLVEDLHVKNFIPTACLVYPALALTHRAFDPSLVLNEDWDFILNVLTDYRLRHAPVDGPVIHTRDRSDNRGRRDEHLLPDVFRTIYRNWPAPSMDLKVARRDFFAHFGHTASLDDL